MMLKEKKRSSEIAAALVCSQRTIQREIRRGQVRQLNGATWEYYKVYDADYAQNDYLVKRGGSGPGLKIGHDHKLCEEIEQQIKKGYSPDVIAQNIHRRSDEFRIILSTRTIYNYLAKKCLFECGLQRSGIRTLPEKERDACKPAIVQKHWWPEH